MVAEIQHQSSVSFTENVALLSLLSRAPAEPRENPWPQWAVDKDPNRVLSFDREADLTRTLAFIAGISDSPSHVIATGVEERPSGQGIRVVVAINKVGPRSGNDILARIKIGLENLFRLLVCANNDAPFEGQVLDNIVDMCKHRILSRIGSQAFATAYSRKGKAFFGSPTQQIVDAVYAHGSGKNRSKEVEGFLKGAGELSRRLAKLEACRSDEVACNIKRVVRAAHRLTKATNFDKLFTGITASELNPTTRLGFASRLAKLARYQDCSVYLCQTATELGLFRDAEVTVVSLDEQLFARSLTLPTENCLTSCLSRCQTGAPIIFREKKVISKLDTSSSNFASVVGKILRESRVHAEVQLLSYYELTPVSQKPRIICSSKDACYLCNLLIQLHGTFHIPSTHNYLYPGWRLLPLPNLDRLLAHLNQSLEAKIRELLQGTMTGAKSRLMLTKNVNESAVFPFSTSLPTPTSSLVMLAETSSSPAVEVRGMNDAKQGRQKAEAAFAAGRFDTPPPTPIIGTSDPKCPQSRTLAGRSPASHGNRPATPRSPSPESSKGTQTHAALLNTREEPIRGISGSLGNLTEAGRMSEELDPTNVDGTSEKSRPGSELELSLKSERASQTEAIIKTELEPEPELVPATKLAPIPQSRPVLEPGSKSEPEPEPEPEPLRAASPNSRLDSQLALEPKPGPEFEFTPDQLSDPPVSNTTPEPVPARVLAPTSLPILILNNFKPNPCPNLHRRPIRRPIRSLIRRPNPNLDPDPIPIQNPSPRRLPRQILTRGQTLTLHLSPAYIIPPITAGPITLHPEFIHSLAASASRSTSESIDSQIKIRVQRLRRHRAAAFYVARPRGFIDLDLCQKGMDIDGSSSECVYVAYRGEVVFVDVTRG